MTKREVILQGWLSLSRIVTLNPSVSLATVGQIDQDSPQLVSIRVAGDLGDVSFIVTRNGIGLWSGDENTMIGRLNWGHDIPYPSGDSGLT